MKKKIISLICLIVVLSIGVIFYNYRNTDTTENGLTVLQLNEVTRSVFYSPQYVAIANGFFV